jgi:hypothetical protein
MPRDEIVRAIEAALTDLDYGEDAPYSLTYADYAEAALAALIDDPNGIAGAVALLPENWRDCVLSAKRLSNRDLIELVEMWIGDGSAWLTGAGGKP